MAKHLLEVWVDIPEGWEWTGEYRRAAKGQGYLTNGQAFVWTCHIPSTNDHPILRKIKPVRESRWLNINGSDDTGVLRGSLEISRRVAGAKCTGCIRIDFENGVPVHVALEPAEGEG